MRSILEIHLDQLNVLFQKLLYIGGQFIQFYVSTTNRPLRNLSFLLRYYTIHQLQITRVKLKIFEKS